MSKKKLSAGKAHEKARLAALKASKQAARVKTLSATEQIEKIMNSAYRGRNAVKRAQSRLDVQRQINEVIEQEKMKDPVYREFLEFKKKQEEEAQKKEDLKDKIITFGKGIDWSGGKDYGEIYQYQSVYDECAKKGLDVDEKEYEDALGFSGLIQ